MCCRQLAEIQDAKLTQKNRHLRTIAQLCRAESSQLRHVSTVGKKIVKQQYVLQMPSQYSKFQRLLRLAFVMQRRRSPEANQTLHDVWPSPGLVHYYILFGGSCPLTEFCPVQNSLYVQVLSFPILAALLHGAPAVDVSQTLRRRIRNGIT